MGFSQTQSRSDLHTHHQSSCHQSVSFAVHFLMQQNFTNKKKACFFFFGCVLFFISCCEPEHMGKMMARTHTLNIPLSSPPGGRDKRGGPVLTFPSRTNHDRIRHEDLRRLIAYLAGIPRYARLPQKSLAIISVHGAGGKAARLYSILTLYIAKTQCSEECLRACEGGGREGWGLYFQDYGNTWYRCVWTDVAHEQEITSSLLRNDTAQCFTLIKQVIRDVSLWRSCPHPHYLLKLLYSAVVSLSTYGVIRSIASITALFGARVSSMVALVHSGC